MRNWDYRYCWLRDATFTLYALMMNGYIDEARAWRTWLVNAVAGRPEEMQIMYAVAGERRLTELELTWLKGYEGSAPVRTGNAAYRQHQLDVYGEVMDALHAARRFGLPPDENAWHVQEKIAEFVEQDWRKPDEGIWEVRGPQQHFVHSKVMAWVAVDRMIKAIERSRLRPGDRRTGGGAPARPSARRSSTRASTPSWTRSPALRVEGGRREPAAAPRRVHAPDPRSGCGR